MCFICGKGGGVDDEYFPIIVLEKIAFLMIIHPLCTLGPVMISVIFDSYFRGSPCQVHGHGCAGCEMQVSDGDIAFRFG